MQVKRSLAVAAMLVTVAASTAAGAVKTREIEYKQEGTGTPLKGMVAWDDAKTGKRAWRFWTVPAELGRKFSGSRRAAIS